MQNGIYSVTFESDAGWIGIGVAILHGGKIAGGDDEYLYGGSYTFSPTHDYQATVNVERIRGRTVNIFGTHGNFQVELTGNYSDMSFEGAGSATGDDRQTLSVRGSLIERLPSTHPMAGICNPFAYLQQATLELALLPTVDSQGLLEYNQLNQVQKAKNEFSSGDYIPALCLIFPMMEAAVNEMVRRAGQDPRKLSGLSEKIGYLSENQYLPIETREAPEVVKIRNLVLHGAYNPPPEGVYPLCLYAFLYLNRILTEYNRQATLREMRKADGTWSEEDEKEYQEKERERLRENAGMKPKRS